MGSLTNAKEEFRLTMSRLRIPTTSYPVAKTIHFVSHLRPGSRYHGHAIRTHLIGIHRSAVENSATGQSPS